MPRVELREVSLTFDDHNVLERLNLNVAEGEYAVLLGPSGCGKTSLLRLIAGLIQPNSGSILLGGLNVADQAPRHRNVALVPQSGGLYPHLSIGKSMELGIRDRLSRAERRVRVLEAAKFVEIDRLLDRRPQQLSGGQLRRAALAKAVASGANVRLLDEPLSAIDARLRFRIERDLKRVHNRHPGTTIHVTHDGSEALRLGDKIGVLEKGHVVQWDTPEHIATHPASPAVAAALGGSPFLTARLKRQGGSWVGPTGTAVPGPCSAGEESITVGFYQNDASPLTSEVASLPNHYVDEDLGVVVPLEKLKWFGRCPSDNA